MSKTENTSYAENHSFEDEALQSLRASAEELGLRNAIINKIRETSAQLPDGELPNGLSVEAAADSIIQTAQRYTQSRDEGLTAEKLQEKIGKIIFTMDNQTALQYLAGLKLLLKNWGKSTREAFTQEEIEEQLQQEMGTLASDGSELSVEERIEELVESIPKPELGDIGSFAVSEEFYFAVCEGQADTSEEIAKKIWQNSSWEDHALCGTLVYCRELTETEDNPYIDPGILTATTAANTDVLRVKMMEQNNEISHEEALIALNDIEYALADATAFALALTVGLTGVALSMAVFGALISVGWVGEVACLVAYLLYLLGIVSGIGVYSDLQERLPEAFAQWKRKNWNKIKAVGSKGRKITKRLFGFR